MSTINLSILDRMKFLEEKISLLEDENLRLKMLVEVATTTTTQQLSTVKAAQSYVNPISTELPFANNPRKPFAGFIPQKPQLGIDLPSNYTSTTQAGFPGTNIDTSIPTGTDVPTVNPNLNTGKLQGTERPTDYTATTQAGIPTTNINTSIPTGTVVPTEPPSGPPPTTSPFQQFIQRRSGTSTKDVASIAGSKYLSNI